MASNGLPDPDDIQAIARHRLEILEAYALVMERRDEFVGLVGSAASADDARAQLQERFSFTDVQALAVLDLQVRRFARFERSRILDECAELRSRLASS